MVTKLQIAGKLKFYSKPYGRQWKWRYQVHGHMINPKLKIPKGLENVKIIDPLIPEKIEQPKWTPPRPHPVLKSFLPPVTIKDHINYQNVPIKLCDKTTKFHAGIDQVCLLTKTMPIQGLPESFNSITDDLQIENQDELIKSYIRQALAYNPNKLECRGFKVPTDPKINVRTEFATPFSVQMRIILDNLIRLSNIALYKKYPNAMTNRQILEKNVFQTKFNRADDTIQIMREDDYVVLNSNQIKAVANDEKINETLDYKLIDMYPIFPTIDLKEQHIYDLKEQFTLGWKYLNHDNSIHYIDTIFHINDDDFTTEADTSRLIMFAFGNAYAQSQLMKQKMKLDLDNDGRLKKPIVIKAVSITNQRLNYVVFQLNTLNLNENKGIKNLVFYDSNNELYLNRLTKDKIPYASHKNIQRMAMRYLNYNPAAFHKLLSMLAYGAGS